MLPLFSWGHFFFMASGELHVVAIWRLYARTSAVLTAIDGPSPRAPSA